MCQKKKKKGKISPELDVVEHACKSWEAEVPGRHNFMASLVYLSNSKWKTDTVKSCLKKIKKWAEGQQDGPKVPASKPGHLDLSSSPIWWKEKTDVYKLCMDHVYVCLCSHTHTHIYKYKLIHLMLTHKVILKSKQRGWRVGSTVKNTCCSAEDQSLVASIHMVPQNNLLTRVPGDLIPSTDCLRHKHACDVNIHATKTLIHIK